MCGSMTFFGLRGQVVQQQLMLMNFKGTVPNYDAKHNLCKNTILNLEYIGCYRVFYGGSGLHYAFQVGICRIPNLSAKRSHALYVTHKLVGNW